MKKLQLTIAMMATVLFGCSEQSNPVGPAETLGVLTTSTIAKPKVPHIAKPKVSPIAKPNVLAIDAPDTNIVSVSEAIVASVGGSVRLQGAFANASGDLVTYDLSILFPAGALPGNTTISISIDKTTFADNGLVTFGPHGIVFNTPGTLSLNATNIDFVKKNQTVSLYYDNNGVMELMPDSWGSVTKKKSVTSVVASAKIPHFSIYAFGRYQSGGE
jgi:hypothetical protein